VTIETTIENGNNSLHAGAWSALRYYSESARRAARGGDFEAAASRFERAVRCMDRVPLLDGGFLLTGARLLGAEQTAAGGAALALLGDPRAGELALDEESLDTVLAMATGETPLRVRSHPGHRWVVAVVVARPGSAQREVLEAASGFYSGLNAAKRTAVDAVLRFRDREPVVALFDLHYGRVPVDVCRPHGAHWAWG